MRMRICMRISHVKLDMTAFDDLLFGSERRIPMHGPSLFSFSSQLEERDWDIALEIYMGFSEFDIERA